MNPPLLDHLLLALDGSERSAAVADQLEPLLAVAERVTLLTVAPPADDPGATDDDRAGDAAAPAAAAHTALTRQAAALRTRHGKDIGVRVEVDEDVVAAICATASDVGASMLALTTHGRRGLARVVFGIVAEALIRCSPAPLLVCPSFVRGDDGDLHPSTRRPLELTRILVPVDDAPGSLDIAGPARSLAAATSARLVALTVDVDGDAEGTAALLARAAEALTLDGQRALTQTRAGDPTQAILACVDEGHADLVAMATHGRSGPALWLHGSVADGVLRNARLPCLLTRITSPA